MSWQNKIAIELLAPAKNLEIGKIAIAHGADAVYIGPSDFGARAAVGNTLEDIAELVSYARTYGAKVYATLNTLLFDQEIEPAYRLAWDLYRAGVDALIVQDMALCDLERLPPIELHASTQTHNYTTERIQFLESLGFDRVILARECTLDQISHIRKHTQIPLEAFVHGALCVSFSGQCYLSAALNGRSANRGVCAQACRYAYDLINAEGKIVQRNKHLLSLKDNCQLEHLPELIKAGVTSFKIEGRLKDVDYVKNVVSAYRQELDRFILTHPDYIAAGSGKVTHRFRPQLSASFNRAFTPYFYAGRSSSMISPLTPKSIGEYVGTVQDVLAGNQVIVNQTVESNLSNGDGLIFFTPQQFIGGTRLNAIHQNKLVLNDCVELHPGDRVYRNFNHQFQKMILAEGTAIRQIPVHLIVTETKDGEMSVVLKDEQDCKAEIIISSQERGDIAQKPEVVAARFIQAFSKLGDSPFVLQENSIPSGVIRVVPQAVINGWRRQLVHQLLQNRQAKLLEQNKQREEAMIQRREALQMSEKQDYTFIRGDFRDNIANKKALDFIRKYTDQSVGTAFESETGNPLDIPVMTCKYCVRYELGFCRKQAREKTPLEQENVSIAKSDWTEPMYLRSNTHLLRLSFNCKACEMEIFLEK